jgi:hypothetical protein
MIELDMTQRDIVYELCNKSEEVLVRSAMEGTMGRVWVEEIYNPTFCLVLVGDFAYLLGLPPRGKQALDLRATLIMECEEKMINPEYEAWSEWLEENLDCSYRKLSRYALRKKDKKDFDLDLLDSYINALPSGFEIRMIGEKEYEDALKEEWSRDFVGNYKDVKDFLENGLGYVIYSGDTLVSGCSAYGFSEGYLEVEVGTKIGYKRKGLGIAASASFIKKCVENDIYPNWDAANMHSVELASKLGYVFDKEYIVYQIHED